MTPGVEILQAACSSAPPSSNLGTFASLLDEILVCSAPDLNHRLSLTQISSKFAAVEEKTRFSSESGSKTYQAHLCKRKQAVATWWLFAAWLLTASL